MFCFAKILIIMSKKSQFVVETLAKPIFILNAKFLFNVFESKSGTDIKCEAVLVSVPPGFARASLIIYFLCYLPQLSVRNGDAGNP